MEAANNRVRNTVKYLLYFSPVQLVAATWSMVLYNVPKLYFTLSVLSAAILVLFVMVMSKNETIRLFSIFMKKKKFVYLALAGGYTAFASMGTLLAVNTEKPVLIILIVIGIAFTAFWSALVGMIGISGWLTIDKEDEGKIKDQA